MHEKGKFPSQTLPNPRVVHEVSSFSEPNPRINEVKAIITLRSSEQLKQPEPKPTEEGQEIKEAEPDEVVTTEPTTKKSTLPPFSQALKAKIKAVYQAEILEGLRQVKVNIPQLDMIKQVPTYAKFLKDLCTIKSGLNVDKKAFLTKQVSAIIQCKTLVKYKDPGCPTISINIGGTCVEKELLDLEDVLIQVDKFPYLVDFVVLDTKPAAVGANYVPIIPGRPLLATSNAIINW